MWHIYDGVSAYLGPPVLPQLFCALPQGVLVLAWWSSLLSLVWCLSLVLGVSFVVLVIPLPFQRLLCHCPTYHPPHEQLLTRLEVGGMSSMGAVIIVVECSCVKGFHCSAVHYFAGISSDMVGYGGLVVRTWWISPPGVSQHPSVHS